MREQFHNDLEQLAARVGELIARVESAIRIATQALLDADLSAAESVIGSDSTVDALCRDIEAEAIELQVRQQPVARDLRLLLVVQRVVADLERSGDLAKNIAKQARRRYPKHVVPDNLRQTVADMGESAAAILHKAGVVFAEQDATLAKELETDDDHMDELHRQLLRQIVAGTGSDEVETTVELTLCGRFYERFADHAVAIARQVVYLSTGELA